MKKIGLATYIFKIREKGKPKNEGYCKFDALPKDITIFNTGESHFYDAIDVIKEIFKIQPRFTDKNRDIISDIIDIKYDEDRIIYGLLGYGEYGTARTIVDTTDKKYKKELTGDKGVEHPHYFMFKLPKGQDIGVLFLERRGNYGLKTLVHKWINTTLTGHKVYNKFAVDLEHLVDKRVFKKYIDEGVLHSLKYIKTSIPRNSFQKRKIVKGKLEVKVKFKDHPHLIDLFNHVNIFDNEDNEARKEFLYFLGEPYDDLTFKIDAGDSPRTFSYGHPEKSAPYLDITNELKIKEGNPSLKSIHEVAKKYEKEMISNIWRTD